MFTIIAFYTIDTPYQDEVKILEASVKKLTEDVEIYVRGYVTTGSWVTNCGLKPQFILDYLIGHTEDVLYLDADAIIHSYPRYFDTFTGDIGVHYKDGKQLLSGTIFLKNNEKVIRLLKLWVKEQKANPKDWDQKILQRLLEVNKWIDVVKIPGKFTKIFDMMPETTETVIEHFQASRRFRKVVGQ